MMSTKSRKGVAATGGKNRWFQIGLVTAGTAAPLFARWRALRANERAAEQGRRLLDQAGARWSDAVSWVAQTNPQAQDALRQFAPAARQALDKLPIGGSRAGAAPEITIPTPAARRPSATPWLIGVGVGVVVAGAAVFVIVRNRIAQGVENESLVELSLPDIAAAESLANEQAALADLDIEISDELDDDEEPGFASDPIFDDGESAGAAFIGNITTQVYHAADSTRLPAPEHRIYFASEEEAISAGYHRDRTELARQGVDQPGAE